MKKELYVFKIGGQNREGRDQGELRRGILTLLDIAPIEFKLDSAFGEGNYKRVLEDQSFTFETQVSIR